MLMSNIPNTITKKFQEQVNSLIKEGIVKNRQQIIDDLTWGKTQMSQAMAGTKNVPFEVYQKFVSKYDLKSDVENVTEASYGTKDEMIALLKQNNKLLEEQLNSATGELRHIMVMNFAMLKSMRGPLARLLAKSEKESLLVIANKIDKETASIYRSIRERGSLVDLGI